MPVGQIKPHIWQERSANTFTGCTQENNKRSSSYTPIGKITTSWTVLSRASFCCMNNFPLQTSNFTKHVYTLRWIITLTCVRALTAIKWKTGLVLLCHCIFLKIMRKCEIPTRKFYKFKFHFVVWLDMRLVMGASSPCANNRPKRLFFKPLFILLSNKRWPLP